MSQKAYLSTHQQIETKKMELHRATVAAVWKSFVVRVDLFMHSIPLALYAMEQSCWIYAFHPPTTSLLSSTQISVLSFDCCSLYSVFVWADCHFLQFHYFGISGSKSWTIGSFFIGCKNFKIIYFLFQFLAYYLFKFLWTI